MSISATTPITPAWNHMVRILFQPFQFKKWLLLGFCAFLYQCDQGGGSGGSNWMQNTQNYDDPFSQAKDWISANWGLFLGLAIGIFLVFTAIWLLVTWLSSRGSFMLLDGIVKNRGAVKEPWREYRPEGNSLFVFKIAVGICGFIAFGIAIGLPIYIALPDIQSEVWSNSATNALIVGIGLFIPFIIVFGILFPFFLKVFLIPTMYLKRVQAMEGVHIAWDHFCKGHIGSAILLFLMFIVFGLGAGIAAVLVTCATCCIAGLPYVSSVVFLPITVFFACYVIEYLQQFGDQWQFFPPMCSYCGYDRQGIEEQLPCPECGEGPPSNN